MEKSLRVYLPYSKDTITQKFGDNANSSYAAAGLKGHSAYDWGVPYGTTIPNCTKDAYCYSIMHQNDPVLMDYRAAFFIVETETGIYEVSYGHMSTILAIPGKTYQPGTIIGLVGNTGPVFIGQHEVTEAEKDAGSHAGSHLHGPQIRPVVKTKYSTTFSNYLVVENGHKFVDKDGFFYGIKNYENGYNGCVSLAPFSTETLATDYKEPVNVHVVADTLPELQTAVAAVQSLPQASQQALWPSFITILQSLLKLLKGDN